MDNIFFNIEYGGLQQSFLKLGVFVLTSIFLLWVIHLTLTKLLFRKNKQRKELNLRLVFLWTIFVYFILFNVYLFILFYRTGTDTFNFASGNFYLGIMAQLTIYIVLIVFFLLKRQAIKKTINGASIN